MLSMIWVGGGILVHGLEEFGLGIIAHVIHDAGAAAGQAMPVMGGFVEGLVSAIGSGIVGLVVGAVVTSSHRTDLIDVFVHFGTRAQTSLYLGI